MNKTEEMLAAYFERKYCLLTNCASTGIYLILKSLDYKSTKVLYPAVTCIAPVKPAVYAGMQPVFCDINRMDYTMDIAIAREMIAEEDIGVVIPTHLYGHACDMTDLIETAGKHGVFVLEDAASAVGGTYCSKKLGSYGEASVVSFGHSKILDCDGGGAILTDDVNIYKAVKKSNDLLPVSSCEKNLLKISKATEQNIYNNFHNLEQVLKERVRRRKLYEENLNKEWFEFPVLSEGSVNWRYALIYKGNRDEFLEMAKEENIDVGFWFSALYNMNPDQDESYFPFANYFSDRVINLRTAPKYNFEKLTKDVENINKYLSRMV